ncbi:MAG TPA: copper resistance CopC family protein [Dactylosporangium sp.]|nr:copper resistance CopC family protein [Dactylosporangium sp.]
MRLPVTIRAALAATAATMLVVLLPAQPAWAHARLLSTSPAEGASVTTPVTAVVLTFNEPVKQQFSTIVVTGADGVSHSQGSPRSVDATLSQTVGALPSGPVRVAWRTVSSDGHPIEGQYTFTNAAVTSTPPPSAAPSPSPTTAATTAQQAAATESQAAGAPVSNQQGSSTAVWWIVGAVVVLLAVAGGWVWSRRRRADAG